MSFDIYAEFGKFVDAKLVSATLHQTLLIIQWLKPIFNNILIIYVALWGFAHMMGKIDELLIDGLIRIIKISVIITFALNISVYAPVVEHFFYGASAELSGVITGSPGTDSLEFLDQQMQSAYLFGKRAWDMGSIWDDPGALLFAGLVWFSALPLTLYAAVLVLLSKFAIAMLLVLGPIAIVLTLFDSTKRFLDTWLIQLVNYALVAVLAAISIALLFGLMEIFLQQMETRDKFEIFDALRFVAMCGILLVVFIQIPNIASGLAGGIALSTLGGVRAGWNRLQGGMGRIGHNARPTTWSRRFDVAKREYQATTRFPRYLNSLRARNSIRR